jgi:hypothetical protein
MGTSRKAQEWAKPLSGAGFGEQQEQQHEQGACEVREHHGDGASQPGEQRQHRQP